MKEEMLFISLPQGNFKPISLDQKLEQLWDEFADELGCKRKGDYLVKENQEAKLTKQMKDEIINTQTKDFKKIQLNWRELR